MTSGDNRGRALIRGVVAVLLSALSACSMPAPSATSWPASPGAVPSPLLTPSASGQASPTAGAIELHVLDPRHVPAGSPTAANGQVLWTAGEVWPSELWRYVPGSPEPERLFSSPRKQSNITSFAAGSPGYAFVELSKPAFGDGGWRIWFLSGPGAEPVELDRGRAKASGYAPTIAMDDERIAWTAFDEPESGPVSRLRVVSMDQPDAVTTLREVAVRDELLWFPDLNGTELWFATIRADFDVTGVGDEFHIEMFDLANPDAPAVRFPGSANDFNPAVNDAFVAWKTAGPGDAALNWGTIHVLNRATQRETTIDVDKANRPTLGDRYIAFEEITRSRLAVYDTRTGSLVDLAPAGPVGS